MSRSYEQEARNVTAELQKLVGQYDSRVLAACMLVVATKLFEVLITAGVEDLNDVLHELHNVIDHIENSDYSAQNANKVH